MVPNPTLSLFIAFNFTSHQLSITSKPIVSISPLLIRDGGGCSRTISYDLLVVDVSYLYLERGNRATKHNILIICAVSIVFLCSVLYLLLMEYMESILSL